MIITIIVKIGSAGRQKHRPLQSTAPLLVCCFLVTHTLTQVHLCESSASSCSEQTYFGESSSSSSSSSPPLPQVLLRVLSLVYRLSSASASAASSSSSSSWLLIIAVAHHSSLCWRRPTNCLFIARPSREQAIKLKQQQQQQRDERRASDEDVNMLAACFSLSLFLSLRPPLSGALCLCSAHLLRGAQRQRCQPSRAEPSGAAQLLAGCSASDSGETQCTRASEHPLVKQTSY